jgi:hypothetical protein
VTAGLVGAGVVAASLAAACGAQTSVLDTGGLVRVNLSSYQALPPPLGSAQAVLTSAASLAGFRRAMAADDIGVRAHPTESGGCAGGVGYTIVLTDGGGRTGTTLDAYRCAGQITGALTGNVGAFLDYLDTLLVATPSDQS